MSGQHKQGDVNVTFWIPRPMREYYRAMAERQGLSLSDFIKVNIEKGMKDETSKHEQGKNDCGGTRR